MSRIYRHALAMIAGLSLLFLTPTASFGVSLVQNLKVTAMQSLHECASGYYKNSNGSCVHRPAKAATWPLDSTAKCNDSSYSYSQHRRGTCSHHGGVSSWR